MNKWLMDKYKAIYSHPIFTDFTTYLLTVYIPRRGKEKYYLTVVDGKDDLKFCECLPDWVETRRRIQAIEEEIYSY